MSDPRLTGDEHVRRQGGAGLMGRGGEMVVLSGLCSAGLVVNSLNSGGYSLDIMLLERFGWIPILAGVVIFFIGLSRYRKK